MQSFVFLPVTDRDRNHEPPIQTVDKFGLGGIVGNDRGVVFGPRFLDGFHDPLIGYILFDIQRINHFAIAPFQHFVQGRYPIPGSQAPVVFQKKRTGVRPGLVADFTGARGRTLVGIVVHHHQHAVFGLGNIALDHNGHLPG